MMNRFKLIIPCCCIIIALASCGGNAKKQAAATADSLVRVTSVNQIVGVALVEPKQHTISLYPESGGVVRKILHDINDDVKEGDVIVQMESQIEQAQLEQAQSKVATQQALIASAKSQLQSTKSKLENARVNYERNKNLVTSGGVTQQTTDDSKFTYESLQADIQTAEANIQQQESKLKELNADINYYQKVLDHKKIKAPTDGKVLSMDVKIGNNVATNQSVCDFAPAGPLMAVTEVDELFADKVSVGLNAYIRPQGKTDTLANGKIILTSPYLRKKTLFSDGAANMEDRRVREVRVLLDSTGKALIGSRVECVILLK